ncbi:MAG: hypothetical protein WCC60_13700, partial [Ilumatobacteraceae bacterium]
MGLLAYDPDRVGRLHLAMSNALDELRAVRCTDPAAADAMRAVNAAATQLEVSWLPLVFRLLSTDPLSGGQRRDAGFGALDQSLVRVMADGYGWAVQADPLADDATVVTPEEARALGATLGVINVEALLDDPQQLHWLALQLEVIGRDPALSAAFIANFHGWAELCDRLAGRRALLLAETPSQSGSTVADLDGVFAGLAHVQRQALITAATDECVTPTAVIAQMEEMNPYSAALLVRSLGLDGAMLAHVADQLLVRWRNMPWRLDQSAPPSDFSFWEGPNTGDILFQVLLLDPAACAVFVGLAVEHPDVLFATATDPGLAHQVIATATDPARTPAAEAAALIVPILEYFEGFEYGFDVGNEGYDGSWPLFLVDLISPWTMQFSPLNDDWSLSARRKADLLSFVVDDANSLARLVANADTVRDGAIATLATGDSHTLEEFAAYLGLLSQVVL